MEYTQLIGLISKNIKRERIEKGFSQKKLASKSGLSLSCISDIESGNTKNILIGSIYKLSVVFKTPLLKLFE